MSDNVIRFADYEKRQQKELPIDPATIIVLPVIRVERNEPEPTPPKTPYGSVA